MSHSWPLALSLWRVELEPELELELDLLRRPLLLLLALVPPTRPLSRPTTVYLPDLGILRLR